MEINFFPIGFPNREMPFWTNTRGRDDRLSKDERLLEPKAKGPTRKTVLVGEGPPPPGFDEARLDPRELPPGIVQLHIQAGLAQGFRDLGYRVVPLQLGLRCFAPDDELQNGAVPDFIRVVRGVELRVDHLGVRPDRTPGCFVAPRALVEFRFGLDDLSVAEAAENRIVSFKHDNTYWRGRLVRVDRERSNATVASGDDEIEVALDEVLVPGDAKIVSRYCQLSRRGDEAGRVYVAGQIANFRLSPQGKRNRRWLAQQYEYLRNWLLTSSKAGYVRFPWPRSDDQLTLSVRPSEAHEAA